MPHIGQHCLQPILCDHPVQFLHALFIRRQLRPQIGDILLRVARRMERPAQNLQHLRLAVHPAIDQLEIVDQHTFLVDMRRIRRG